MRAGPGHRENRSVCMHFSGLTVVIIGQEETTTTRFWSCGVFPTGSPTHTIPAATGGAGGGIERSCRRPADRERVPALTRA
jgi:hypothetical protein